MRNLLSLSFALLLLVAGRGVCAREWCDPSGHYAIEATLVGFNESGVILQKANRDLLSMKVDQLCEADREYLESEEAAAATAAQSKDDSKQSWTLRNGLKIKAQIVGYARKEVTFQRRRNKIYVNDVVFENLPGVYREMAPRIVGHFEMKEIHDKKGLEEWAKKLRAEPKSFTVDGVQVELENGDLYGVPFFFFSAEDRKILEPGWERWLAAENDRQARAMQALELEARAREYQRDREMAKEAMRLQLFLQGYDAGLFDLWEVSMFPTVRGDSPVMVVVPGRNNQEAAAEALKKYPNHKVGPVAKVRRRR